MVKRITILSYYIQRRITSANKDRNQTVLRRFELRSRTALLDEQSNPYNHLQLQEAMIQHRGANRARR